MTIYDAAMVIVVVLGMIRGAWRGFTWQVASIASLALGYTAARSGSDSLAASLPGAPEVQRVLAMAVLYIAVSGGVFGLAWMVRGTLRKLKFEAYDRHLGTLLGGIEGLGVGILVTLFLVSLSPASREPIFSSPTGHVVGVVMSHLGPLLPEEVRKVLAPHWDSLGPTTSPVVAVAPLPSSSATTPPVAPLGRTSATVPPAPQDGALLRVNGPAVAAAASDAIKDRLSASGKKLGQALEAALEDQLRELPKRESLPAKGPR